MDESRSAAATQGSAPTLTAVVTVHGLWMRGATMAALRHRFETRGWRVVAFEYSSVKGSLEANAASLARFVDGVQADVVHMIGHSLGGVLIRQMLEDRAPARLGRVVCLGSPFRGSRTAALLARWPGGRSLIGRSLAELNACGGFKACAATVEIGSIAGCVPLGFGRLLGPFREPNDGTVAVAETKIEGLADHVVLPVSHVSLLWSKAVAEESVYFLEHGRFRHEGAAS